MRVLSAILVLLGAFSLALPARADSEVDRRQCVDNDLDPAPRIEACNRVIGEDDLSVESYLITLMNRGFAYGAKGDHARAITDFSEVIGIDPKLAFAYFGRGAAYAYLDEHSRAIADYDETIRLDPNNPYVYAFRGDVYLALDQYDRAIVDYNRAIRLDDSNADAYGGRASAYTNKGEYDRSILDYSKAIRLDPGSASSHTFRGVAYFLTARYRPAIVDFEKAGELDPAYPYNLLWQVMALRSAGMAHEGAAQDYQNSFSVSGEWPRPLIDFSLGELTEQEAREAALHSDPKTTSEQQCEVDFYLGVWALTDGAREKAVALFENAANTCPAYFIELGAAKAMLARMDKN